MNLISEWICDYVQQNPGIIICVSILIPAIAFFVQWWVLSNEEENDLVDWKKKSA